MMFSLRGINLVDDVSTLYAYPDAEKDTDELLYCMEMSA